MANAADEHHGGPPLESFTKGNPPGWRPGEVKYPFRRYEQLLRLWWRVTDLPDTAKGPSMAGRLRGTGFQLAMALSHPRCRGPTSLVVQVKGEELLAEP